MAKATVATFEAGRRAPYERTLDDIRSALEAAGVEFIPENGGGAGVRLRKGKPASDHPKPVGPATDMIGEMDKAIDKDRSRKR